MPSKNPESEMNESLVVKLDPASLPFGFGTNQVTPALARSIMNNAEVSGEIGPLYDIYERMETTDTMYGGLVEQLKSALAGYRVKVVPAPTTNETERALAEDYAETVREAMSGLNVHALTRAFTEPHFIGARLFFLTWELRAYGYGRKLWMPKSVQAVRGRYLKVEKNWNDEDYGHLKVITKDARNGVAVSKLPMGSAILLEKEMAHDRYYALGAARKCLPWFLGIQYVQSWWVQYIESYGAPMRVGRYPRGTGRETKAELTRFLRLLGKDGYALFPNDMELQLIEANRQGSITTYNDFIGAGHKQYAINLLGQADTVGGQSQGGYARSVVANSIRHEVLQEAGAFASQGWEALARNVIFANYGMDADPRLFPSVRSVIVTPHEMQAKATAFSTLTQSGTPVPAEYPYEQILGVEPPRVGELCFVNGQTYRYGVDPMPPPMEQVLAKEQAKAAKENADRTERDRSVANPDNNETRSD